jgi:hypothetical protein
VNEKRFSSDRPVSLYAPKRMQLQIIEKDFLHPSVHSYAFIFYAIMRNAFTSKNRYSFFEKYSKKEKRKTDKKSLFSLGLASKIFNMFTGGGSHARLLRRQGAGL